VTKATTDDSQDSDCEAIKVEELMKNDKIISPSMLKLTSAKSSIDEETKIERFDKLGDYSKQKDGQIIEEDSDDDIEVEQKSYYKLFNIQGGLKMLVLTQLGMCVIEYFHRNAEHNEKQFSHNTSMQQTNFMKYLYATMGWWVCSFAARTMKSTLDY